MAKFGWKSSQAKNWDMDKYLVFSFECVTQQQVVVSEGQLWLYFMYHSYLSP